MRSPAKGPAVIVSRELPAPPARVFDWLTDPAKLALWMSPQGRVTAQTQARPGGRLLIVMRDGETPMEHRGEYLEVVPPRRLVFTWNSAGRRGTEDRHRPSNAGDQQHITVATRPLRDSVH